MTAEDDPGAEHKPSGARRVVHIVGAVVVVLVLPALVIGAFVGELGVSAMFTGVLLGAVGAKLGGTHRMLYVAPALGVAGGLGAYTAYDWWWVALLAAAGVIAGAGIRFGWFAALLMVPYAATFVTPVSTVTDAVIYGVILAIASLYGVVLARRFGAPAIVDGDHLAPRVAAGVAGMFGLVLGATAAIGVALGWTEPYWVPEPVLILVLYIIMGKRDRIRGKALGTALGIAAADPDRHHLAASSRPHHDRHHRLHHRAHAGQDLLADVWPLHLLARAPAVRTRQGRLRGRGTRR